MPQAPATGGVSAPARTTTRAVQSPAPEGFGAPVFAGEWGIVALLAAAACLLHFLVNLLATGHYGLFRDELYYAACGEHLAWGYVDHPPLVAVIAWLSRRLLGDSLFALRFFPALAAGAKVLLTGWMVGELRGGRVAQALAATAVFVAPVYLTFDNFLSMNAFEPVFWMLCAAIAMRIINSGTPRLWLLFGLVAGMGLLNKHSMLFFDSGVFVGLVLTPERQFLRSRWIWLGGLLAFSIFLPNLVWEIRHGWPTIEILENVRRLRNTPVGPLDFIFEQALMINPLATPICLAGLYFFLRAKGGRQYRLLGWTYLVILAELLLLKGKIYYLAPAYPMLFAAGGVWLEKWGRERNWGWLNPAIMAPLVVAGLIAAPLALPVLPVEALARYSRFWNVEAVRVENQDPGKLPQLFGDMFGWENQVATVGRVYDNLSGEERSKCAILTRDFGEAGAIDYFGAAYGLPKAISGNNNYYLWGPRDYTGEVVISIGVPLETLQTIFGRIEQAALITDAYADAQENNLPVYICREPKMSLRSAWPKFKEFG